jgi:hypothetical protein
MTHKQTGKSTPAKKPGASQATKASNKGQTGRPAKGSQAKSGPKGKAGSNQAQMRTTAGSKASSY